MDVIFCSITADPKILDKRPYYNATNHDTFSCLLQAPCSMIAPNLVLSIDAAQGYNYAYIPRWERYYFLNPPEIIDGNRCSITGNCDVLTSNADAIKNLTGYVTRSESYKNAFLPDGNYARQSTRLCETLPFNRTPFVANYATDIVYLLTVMGGAHA